MSVFYRIMTVVLRNGSAPHGYYLRNKERGDVVVAVTCTATRRFYFNTTKTRKSFHLLLVSLPRNQLGREVNLAQCI